MKFKYILLENETHNRVQKIYVKCDNKATNYSLYHQHGINNDKNIVECRIFKLHMISFRKNQIYDKVKVYVQAGDGGNGCVAFRREKFVSQGGPTGGNGGRGGNVWAEADPRLSSLSSLKKKVYIRAESGGRGGASHRSGLDGCDCTIRVPCGTIIRHKNSVEWERPAAELISPGEKAIKLRGGRGGRGNSYAKERKKRAYIAEKGQKGQSEWIEFELKMIADVGIVGTPNIGKSSLLSVISSVEPTVAKYTFTTVLPNLGVCTINAYLVTMADLPGILVGAHRGRGLGQDFLRHCERCKLLVHIMDGTSKNKLKDLDSINFELESFSSKLADKPQILAYNKMDLPASSNNYKFICQHFIGEGLAPPIPLSASTGRGSINLLSKVKEILKETSSNEKYTTKNITKMPIVPHTRIGEFQIKLMPYQTEGRQVVVVTGKSLDSFTHRINFHCHEAVLSSQKIIEKTGLFKKLKNLGLRDGDIIIIGALSMSWHGDECKIVTRKK